MQKRKGEILWLFDDVTQRNRQYVNHALLKKSVICIRSLCIWPLSNQLGFIILYRLLMWKYTGWVYCIILWHIQRAICSWLILVSFALSLQSRSICLEWLKERKLSSVMTAGFLCIPVVYRDKLGFCFIHRQP